MSDSIPDNQSAPAACPTQQAAPNAQQPDAAYLKTLTECEQKMIDEFDKAVMTLSGGAIGISFAFLKDIVKPESITNKGWLLTAWTCWGFSVLCVLASFYFSHQAMRKSQRQLSAGERDFEKLGGWWNKATLTLNPTGGVLFLCGLLCMIVFVQRNLPATKNLNSGGTNATATATATITTPTATATATATATGTTATATTFARPNTEPQGATNTGPR